MKNRKILLGLASLSLSGILMFSNTALADFKNAWRLENNIWKYYKDDGSLAKSWINVDNGWYYLNLVNGNMHTSWLDYKGDKYFLNTVSDGTKGKMLTGWQWIDGYCYYFEETKNSTEGRLVRNTKTADGYFVNDKGQWTNEKGEAIFIKGKGISTLGLSPTANMSVGSRYVSSGGKSTGGPFGGGSTTAGSSVNTGEVSKEVSKETNASETSTEASKETNASETSTEANKEASKETNASEASKEASKETNASETSTEANKKTNEETNTNENEASTETTETKQSVDLLDRTYTKLVDLGFAEYVAIAFKEGTVSDYRVLINGLDVSDDLTKIDDAGTLVKWATSIVSPKNIEVIRLSDSKVDKLELAGATNEIIASKKTKNTAPKYILTNGPISIFDYHLDNYDKNGEVRRYPTKTTFDLNANSSEEAVAGLPSAYYVKDVEMDSEGHGQIEIKLSLDAESEKWFDAINELKVLDSNYRHLSTNPIYVKSIDTTYGKTGVIRINLPQSNLRSTGRFYVNLASDYSEDKYTVPVHIIKDTQFVLEQATETPDPELGNADILFEIISKNGDSFGLEILNPIYRVELKFPSGKVKELENIKEYSLIGNSFHIYESYEDKEKNETVTLIDEAGVYEVKIYANGYKPMKKKFSIAGATLNLQGNEEDEVDIVSMATGSASISSGSSSSGSSAGAGGYSINANLLFDYDLLANALVLNKIGKANADSTQVVKVFFTRQIPEIVFADNLEEGYSQRDFLNRVKDARLEENKSLSFADYLADAPLAKRVPSRIKRVLEDGKLGPVESVRDSVGARVGEVSGTTVNAEENFVLSFNESDYISNIEKIYLDGQSMPLRSDSYLKQYEIRDNTLVIFASTLKNYHGKTYIGKHRLDIVARDYQKKTINLTVKAPVEDFALSLLTQNPRLDMPIEIKASSDNEETKGNFLKEMISLVAIDSNNRERAVYKVGVASLTEGYKIENGNIIIEANTLPRAGQYTLVVNANGYQPKSLQVNVLEAVADTEEVNTGETTEKKQAFAPVNKKTSIIGDVILTFDDNEEVSAYLDALTKGQATLKINGEAYTYKTYILGGANKDFKVNKSESGTSGNLVRIAYQKANLPEKYIVEIESELYNTMRFEVSASDKVKVLVDETENGEETGTESIGNESTGSGIEGTGNESAGSGTESTGNESAGSGTEGTGSESTGSETESTGNESAGSETEGTGNETTQEDERLEAPSILGSEERTSFFETLIVVNFEDTAEVDKYLKLLKTGEAKLKINDEYWNLVSFLVKPKQYMISRDSSGYTGYYSKIKFEKNSFKNLGDIVRLSIEAEGYKPLEYELQLR